jgi:hypothetical protein
VGPKVFTRPEIEIAVDIESVTVSSPRSWSSRAPEQVISPHAVWPMHAHGRAGWGSRNVGDIERRSKILR